MPEKNNFKELYDFIDRAVKSRKYPENTAMALKTALNLFEKEISEEERASVEKFKENLDAIYGSVFQKNKDYSAGSLATYKSRVVKVISDYEKYGTDPTKMANWTPKVVTRKRKEKKKQDKKSVTANSGSGDTSYYEFPFEGGVKLFIPKSPKFTESIMDGGLKDIKGKLKEFSSASAEKSPEQNIE